MFWPTTVKRADPYSNRMVTAPCGSGSMYSTWGPPSVDLFASRLNNKLPLNVSLVPDRQAMAQDALSLNWHYLDAYASPPFNLLNVVLRN